MPRFWRFLSGPRVTVRPQVMSGPASPGQQVCTGSRPRSTSAPSHTTSWQGAPERSFGAMSSTFMNTGRVFCHASLRLFGGSGSLRNASSRPTSRRLSAQFAGSAPIARATRCGVPKRLPSTAIVPPPGAGNVPFGRSNSSAGPPALSTRSQSSVISRRGSTSIRTRFSSPCVSSWATKSRRSRYAISTPPRRRRPSARSRR